MSIASDFISAGLKIIKEDALKDLVPPILVALQAIAKDPSPAGRAGALVVLQGQMIVAVAAFDKDVVAELNTLLATEITALAAKAAAAIPPTVG